MNFLLSTSAILVLSGKTILNSSKMKLSKYINANTFIKVLLLHLLQKDTNSVN